MTIDTPADLEGLLAAGRVVARTMHAMAAAMRPGMTTGELDALGADLLAKAGARSAPILTYQYPGHTCISVNDQAAHAIPGDRVIRAGDLVNIDVSAELNGYFGDTGASFAVPPVSAEAERLLATTRAALDAAIGAARAGAPMNAIGAAVEVVAKRGGYRIIRALGGHGIGQKLHEPPHNVPHHYRPSLKRPLTPGLVMTLEPFLTLGSGEIITEADGWTLRTADGALAAQFEHTVVITEGAPILTTLVN